MVPNNLCSSSSSRNPVYSSFKAIIARAQPHHPRSPSKTPQRRPHWPRRSKSGSRKWPRTVARANTTRARLPQRLKRQQVLLSASSLLDSRVAASDLKFRRFRAACLALSSETRRLFLQIRQENKGKEGFRERPHPDIVVKVPCRILKRLEVTLL